MGPSLGLCAWCFYPIHSLVHDDGTARYHPDCWEEMRTQHEINARRNDPPPHEWDGLTPDEGGEDG